MHALGERTGSTTSNRRCRWLLQAWLVINAAMKARDAQRLQAAILTCVQHLAAIDGNLPEAEEARPWKFMFSTSAAAVLGCLWHALWPLCLRHLVW